MFKMKIGVKSFKLPSFVYLALVHCGRMCSLWDRDKVYADHFVEVDFLIILVPPK